MAKTITVILTVTIADGADAHETIEDSTLSLTGESIIGAEVAEVYDENGCKVF